MQWRVLNRVTSETMRVPWRTLWLAGRTEGTIARRPVSSDFPNSTPQFGITRRLQLVKRIWNVYGDRCNQPEALRFASAPDVRVRVRVRLKKNHDDHGDRT